MAMGSSDEHLRELHRLIALQTGDEKHAPSATSTLDVLYVLYERVLRFDPRNPGWEDRDRFLLSKGHGPMAFYAVLARHGFFPEAELERFCAGTGSSAAIPTACGFPASKRRPARSVTGSRPRWGPRTASARRASRSSGGSSSSATR